MSSDNQTNKILVKLTEMCRENAREQEQIKLMIQELTEYYTQLNILTLELAKNTSMSLNALAKRVIDLEMADRPLKDIEPPDDSSWPEEH